MNYELRIMNLTKKQVVLVASLFIIIYSLFFIHYSAEAWVPGEPLVPCGGNYWNTSGVLVPQPDCTQCEILHLLDNLIDFILIIAAPILATLFFVIAGVYIMLGGANPGMLGTGKRIFTETLIGIMIVMLAWLITNTLILTLVGEDFTIGSLDFRSGEWWRLTCGSILNP